MPTYTLNIPGQKPITVKKIWTGMNGWVWYGLRKHKGGLWFGYVKGLYPEFGNFTISQLKSVNARELPPTAWGNIPFLKVK